MMSSHLHKQVLTALLVVSSFTPTLADDTPSSQDYCVWGCNQATSYIGFAGSDPIDLYGTQCSNELFLQSFFNCIQQYCNEKEAEAGLKLQDNVCVTNAGVNLPDYESYKLSPDELAAVEVADATVAAGSLLEPLDYPVIAAELSYQLAYRTTAAHFGNRHLGFCFAWAMYGFWGLVILIGIANRCVEWLKMRRNNSGSYRADSNGLRLWIRKRLLLPATFGKHCQYPVGWCTIPPRLESILLILYLIMNFIFMFPGYDLFEGNLWYPTYELQLSRYIGLRAGIMTISQLPVVWVFAARNDPLLWVTGWSFATFNRFHRWVARLCLLLAMTHAICFSIYTWKSGPGYYTMSWTQEYWYCGAIGVVMISTLVGTSVYIFRVKWYDLFLVVHIALSVVLIVVIWFHVTAFGNDASGFLWMCIAIWSFDRLLRLGRTIYLGVIPRFTKGVKATATYDKSADIVRLDITDLLPSKDITPGRFYYLYAPGNIRGYESHPFTLCSWRRVTSAPTSVPAQQRVISDDDDKESQPTTRSNSTTVGDEIVHSFLVRPYTGFTGRLRDQLMSSSDATTSSQITVFLEGPYGNKTDLRAFSDVLVIAGGNGITSAISHSNFLLPTQATSVHVVWAVQNSGLVDHVCAHELGEAIRHPNFDLTVYETRKAEEKAAASSLYAVEHGRPDIEATIRAAREKSTRNLAVVVCGPPRLADSCRAAVVEVLGESGPSVEFYNEALGW